MKAENLEVWFADLTYTQQVISSEPMPAAVGCIAAFLLHHGPTGIRARVFKYPERLLEALSGQTPCVIAFSNYVWNLNLSTAFAEGIKQRSPSTVTIFGGPNFPVEPEEQEAFLRARPVIDFYVMKEGEAACAELVNKLAQERFDLERLAEALPSVAYISRADGRFYRGEILPRIKDLAAIPSPYLEGLLDDCFDGRLQPIIHTNRGCPFQCTFCVEGLDYYAKVNKTTQREKLVRELEYIAQKMDGIRGQGRRNDLFIADSNFGMFKEDVELCALLASMKDRYNWPDYISVSTGKNNRERVLEGAALLNGAMRLAGSVQTLTPGVLTNIKRGNISAEGLMDVALKANAIGTNSYTELIIGLPGETLESFNQTIETILSAEFLSVQIWQLMLLPGTEMASRESRARYAMQSRFRVLPRCYGFFDLDGVPIESAEIEEICVATDTFSYQDYLEACRFRFFVSTFYDHGVFLGLTKLIKMLGLSVYGWLQDLAHYPYQGAVSGMLENLTQALEKELWTDRTELQGHLRDRNTLQRYINGELGSNLLFKYQALAYLQHVDEFCSVAQETMERRIHTLGRDSELAMALLRELIQYHRFERISMLDTEAVFSGRFRFDVVGFTASPTRPGHVEELHLSGPREVRFSHSAEQKDSIRRHQNVFGTDLAGQTLMMGKVFVKKMFRTAEYVS